MPWWVTLCKTGQSSKKGTESTVEKVAASVHVSIQWKADNEHGRSEWGKRMAYSIVTHLLTQWWRFAWIRTQWVETKTWWRSKSLPTYPSLIFDLLTHSDLAQQEWPRINTVPDLTFSLVTGCDLSLWEWSIHKWINWVKEGPESIFEQRGSREYFEQRRPRGYFSKGGTESILSKGGPEYIWQRRPSKVFWAKEAQRVFWAKEAQRVLWTKEAWRVFWAKEA